MSELQSKNASGVQDSLPDLDALRCAQQDPREWLMVSSLPAGATKEDLLAAFSTNGDIEELKLIPGDQNASTQHFALMRYAYSGDNMEAPYRVVELNGKKLAVAMLSKYDPRNVGVRKVDLDQPSEHINPSTGPTFPEFHLASQPRSTVGDILVSPHTYRPCTYTSCTSADSLASSPSALVNGFYHDPLSPAESTYSEFRDSTERPKHDDPWERDLSLDAKDDPFLSADVHYDQPPSPGEPTSYLHLHSFPGASHDSPSKHMESPITRNEGECSEMCDDTDIEVARIFEKGNDRRSLQECQMATGAEFFRDSPGFNYSRQLSDESLAKQSPSRSRHPSSTNRQWPRPGIYSRPGTSEHSDNSSDIDSSLGHIAGKHLRHKPDKSEESSPGSPGSKRHPICCSEQRQTPVQRSAKRSSMLSLCDGRQRPSAPGPEARQHSNPSSPESRTSPPSPESDSSLEHLSWKRRRYMSPHESAFKSPSKKRHHSRSYQEDPPSSGQAPTADRLASRNEGQADPSTDERLAGKSAKRPRLSASTEQQAELGSRPGAGELSACTRLQHHRSSIDPWVTGGSVPKTHHVSSAAEAATGSSRIANSRRSDFDCASEPMALRSVPACVRLSPAERYHSDVGRHNLRSHRHGTGELTAAATVEPNSPATRWAKESAYSPFRPDDCRGARLSESQDYPSSFRSGQSTDTSYWRGDGNRPRRVGDAGISGDWASRYPVERTHSSFRQVADWEHRRPRVASRPSPYHFFQTARVEGASKFQDELPGTRVGGQARPARAEHTNSPTKCSRPTKSRHSSRSSR